MIKWGFFLKLLKQLFIISLISCFTLLVNSFVSAQSLLWNIQQIWQTFWSFYNNDYEIQVNWKWNLLTQYLWDWKKLLYFQNWTYFFRSTQNDSKPYISVSAYNWQYNKRNQWYVKYYFLCDYISDWSVVNPSNCVRHNIDDWEFPWVAQRLLNSLSNWWYFYYNYYDFYVRSSSSPDYWGLDICFSSTEFDKSLCFYWWLTYSQAYCETYYNNTLWKLFQNGWSWCTTTQSLDNSLNLDYRFDNISQSILWNSPAGAWNWWWWTAFIPSTWSRLWGRLITSSWYTNNQMIEAYECVWLQPALCYWGFPINDIFQPSETFEDFTWYVAWQGATIFDLYNRYSSSFSNINQFLNTVLTRYQNWQINSFKTEPKALLMLGSQMNVAWFKTSYISTYCDLLLNKNNNSTYTWNSVDDLRAQSCYRSQHINDSLKTSDWSDIVWQGSDIWIFWSWENVDFDPETFFSNMMSKIESWLDSVSTWTAVGVIPWYIVLFTLALIFIRMISH